MSAVNQTNNSLLSLQRAVVSTLCYFDAFQHPLTKEEILQNCSEIISNAELSATLDVLVESGIIAVKEEYYFLSESDEQIVSGRREKEKRAVVAIQKSYRFTKLISRFPFVKGVCISGSLSKGVMDTDGDVDYFVITSTGRLWICRSLLILFKKLFLFNSHKYFCTNYFVDTESLQIPDKNIFTATEVVFLKPVVNKELIAELMKANSWTKEFLPNFGNSNEFNCINESRSIFKRTMEWMLKGGVGERLDNYFFKLTLKRWQKKFPNFNKEDFDLNMRTRKNVSKHHPRGYQQKVLQAHTEKLKQVMQQIEEKMVVAA